MRLMWPIVVGVVLLVGGTAVAQEGGGEARRGFTLWIEGEAPTESRMNRHPWWYDRVDRSQLSGGDWISNFKKGQEGIVSYEFRTPGGPFRLWLRANPVRNRLQYQLNRGEWQNVPLDRATDLQNVAVDGKVDLRFLAWIDLGTLDFERGENRLSFRTASDDIPEQHGAIDAFVLTTDADYKPQGTQKPGETTKETAKNVQDTWAFEPATDALDHGSLLDLRSMNEDVAGEHGFIRLSDDGNGFVRGDGEPIRFWAVNDYNFRDLGLEDLKRHAEFLAKRGVNMARWHGQLPDRSEGAQFGDIDEQALDDLHKYVAAFRESGIYLTISPYYPHAMGKKGDGIPESYAWPKDSEGMTGLVYFVPEVQAAYKAWLAKLMQAKNPYTGVPLKDEPAVAIVQMQNEDSLLFWTMSQIQGAEAELLSDRFGKFLVEKYGSLDAAKTAWQGAEPRGALGDVTDDWEAGRIAVSGAWHMTQPADGAFAVRLADQVEFLTTLMRDWHAEVARYLKEDLGSEHLFNAGNWRTADNLLLDDHERYSYALDDAVIGLNRYTTSLHTGPNEGWAIVNGDRYRNESALKHPEKLQVSVKQPEGHPYIFPECLWVPPMWYQAEGPWLTAAYSSLNGADIAYWFAVGEAQWRQPGSANGYLPSVGKWKVSTPGQLGMFPAAALIFRYGYLEEGEPVVIEHRPLAELWNREVPLLGLEGAYDPNRDAEAAEQEQRTPISPDAFRVGPVKVRFEEGEDIVADLGPNVQGNLVTSNTGQLAWNDVIGFATMNAPKAQGAVGFLADTGEIQLNDVAITYAPGEHADRETAPNTGYAAVSVVPLDDRPIADSRKLLVQIGTVARPTNWAAEPTTVEDGKRAYTVTNYGGPPWQVEKATGLSLTIDNPNVTSAVILDPNGMPLNEVRLEATPTGVRLTYPPEAMYVILQ